MTTKRLRPTQAERTSATRTKLLDATIECLVAVGYARTTTTEVSLLAGVSRGAQLHHFPTKETLVAAAIEHVFAKHEAEIRTLVAAQSTTDTDVLIDSIWSIFTSTTYYAWLELLLASRTDPALRQITTAIAARADKDTEAIFHSMIAAPPQFAPFFEVLGSAVWAMFQGMGVARICVPDSPRHRELLHALKTLARLYFPKPSSGSTSEMHASSASATELPSPSQANVTRRSRGDTAIQSKPKKHKGKTS